MWLAFARAAFCAARLPSSITVYSGIGREQPPSFARARPLNRFGLLTPRVALQ